MLIGNPIAILNEQVTEILMEGIKLVGFADKERVEKWIKDCKDRIKKEFDRDIIIEIPFLNYATNSDWLKANIQHYNFLWLKGSFIKIQPKEEDREIDELFRTFPIEGYDLNV